MRDTPPALLVECVGPPPPATLVFLSTSMNMSTTSRTFRERSLFCTGIHLEQFLKDGKNASKFQSSLKILKILSDFLFFNKIMTIKYRPLRYLNILRKFHIHSNLLQEVVTWLKKGHPLQHPFPTLHVSYTSWIISQVMKLIVHLWYILSDKI